MLSGFLYSRLISTFPFYVILINDINEFMSSGVARYIKEQHEQGKKLHGT